MKELVLKLVALVQEMIADPLGFWRSHANSKESRDELLRNWLLPLIGFAALAVFLGEFFRSDYFRIWVALLGAIREILLLAAIYFVGVYGSKEMIKLLGYEVKIDYLQKLVVYSMIPFLIISIVTGLLPFLYFLDIFGVFSFYVFFIGSRVLLKLPKDKGDNIILKIIAANWIVFAMLSFILAKLLTNFD